MAKMGYFSAERFTPRALPQGYTQVEYIESSGTQYIDTGFVPNQDTRVVMEVEQSVTYKVSWLFGVRTASGKNTFAFLAYRDKYRTDYNSTTSSYYDASITAMTHVDKNKNITTLNGTEVITQTYATFNCQYSLLLLAMNTAGTASGFTSAKLRSVFIYDNGTLVRDFVPCRRDSDRAVGLYDMVNGVFYGNVGTGIFTCPEPPMELPQGYTQVAYIESSGTQCINTGFKPNQDTRVVVDIQVVSFDGYAPLFGARVASKNAEYATWAIAETDIQDGYGTQAESKLVAEALKRNIIDKNKNMLYVGGVLLKTHTAQTFAPNYPIFLFNINTAGSTTGSFKTFAKLYSCQIYDNGTLIRDYVPCLNPSGTAGLYDMVNGVFYGNAGTGSLLTGDEVHSDVAREPKKVYFSDNGVAREAKEAYYGDENGIARLWYPIGFRARSLAVGSSVFMNVGGVRTEFLVVHQGLPDSTLYASSCNGTWLLMKNVYKNRKFDSTDNNYGQSDINSYLNGEFLDSLDIKNRIDFVTIPVTNGIGSTGTVVSGLDGMPTKIFLLSYTEVGFSGGDYQGKGANIEGAVLSYFKNATNSDKIGLLNGVAVRWVLRSPYTVADSYVWWVGEEGKQGGNYVTQEYGIRPALILPSSTIIDENMNVIG